MKAEITQRVSASIGDWKEFGDIFAVNTFGRVWESGVGRGPVAKMTHPRDPAQVHPHQGIIFQKLVCMILASLLSRVLYAK